MGKRIVICLAAIVAFFGVQGVSATPEFSGKWIIDKERSTAFDPWSTIVLEIVVAGEQVRIEELVSTGRRKNFQRYELDTKVAVNVMPIEVWTGNRHIGAYIGGDKMMLIAVDWVDSGQTLKLDFNYTLHTSQGERPVHSHKEFRVSSDGDQLTLMEIRSTRPRPILYVFNREQK